MSDDLADLPIVLLENDFPQQVGKIGLYDFLMPMGSTGIVFVAAVPGTLRAWGPSFTSPVQIAARLRAASTAVQMGFMRGEAVEFLRVALQWSQDDLADALGVTLVEVQSWETNTTVIPSISWRYLAQQVMKADGRFLPAHPPSCPPSYRARKIRVFPQTPAVSTGSSSDSSALETAIPLVGPDCEPYGDSC